MNGGPLIEGRRFRFISSASWLLLALVELADAGRNFWLRSQISPDDNLPALIRVSVLTPAAAVLAALAALIAFGAQRRLAPAMRWRRTGVIIFWMYALWLLAQGGLGVPHGVVVAGLSAIGFVAIGRAAANADVEPFEVVEAGLPVHETPSGLRFQDVEVGIGPLASRGRTAVVHYTGWLASGRKFDSSRDRGRPFEFKVGDGRVIAAWDEGVATMHQHGRRRLIVPPELGYGASGTGPIPPNATLVFEVELVDVR
jgi:hypothetical protein